MGKKPDYPLAQVLEVKRRRVDEAEAVVRKKKEELRQEELKLERAKKARDKVLKHRRDKLQQLRDELDTGTTAPKVRQMKQYLEIVKERLAGEEKKVVEQKEQVKQAELRLEEAKEDLRQKRKEVDKLEIHQEEWEKEIKQEMRREEGRRESELGTSIYIRKKRERRK